VKQSKKSSYPDWSLGDGKSGREVVLRFVPDGDVLIDTHHNGHRAVVEFTDGLRVQWRVPRGMFNALCEHGVVPDVWYLVWENVNATRSRYNVREWSEYEKRHRRRVDRRRS
jgi:hypothetical protein